MLNWATRPSLRKMPGRSDRRRRGLSIAGDLPLAAVGGLLGWNGAALRYKPCGRSRDQLLLIDVEALFCAMIKKSAIGDADLQRGNDGRSGSSQNVDRLAHR